jgi:hypothetical protein
VRASRSVHSTSPRSPARPGAWAALVLLATAAACGGAAGDPTPGDRDDDRGGETSAVDAGPSEERPDLGRLVTSFSVPADGSPVATPRLASGRTYRVAVRGVYTWGGCDAENCPGATACGYALYGDAGHVTDSCWDALSDDPVVAYISLEIDDQHVEWGAYRADHAYAIDVVGAGAPLVFHIEDCCYADNVGKLAVALYDLAPPG